MNTIVFTKKDRGFEWLHWVALAGQTTKKAARELYGRIRVEDRGDRKLILATDGKRLHLIDGSDSYTCGLIQGEYSILSSSSSKLELTFREKKMDSFSWEKIFISPIVYDESKEKSKTFSIDFDRFRELEYISHSDYLKTYQTLHAAFIKFGSYFNPDYLEDLCYMHSAWSLYQDISIEEKIEDHTSGHLFTYNTTADTIRYYALIMPMSQMTDTIQVKGGLA